MKIFSVFKIFNFWNFFINLIKEIRRWRVLLNALKEDETQKLFKKCKYELRSTIFGKIYTVINIPYDIYRSEVTRFAYVMEEMKYINDVLLKCRLSDFLYPAFVDISETKSDDPYFAYRIELDIKKENIQFWRFFKESIRWIFLFILFKFVIQLSSSIDYQLVVNFFKSLFEFIF